VEADDAAPSVPSLCHRRAGGICIASEDVAPGTFLQIVGPALGDVAPVGAARRASCGRLSNPMGTQEVPYAMVVILAIGIGLFALPFCAIGRVKSDEARGCTWPYLGRGDCRGGDPLVVDADFSRAALRLTDCQVQGAQRLVTPRPQINKYSIVPKVLS
jgi:hypothetical protein